ncbi:MAG: hypothetical protein AAFR26_10510 [Cyanobacteria bacterium J06626_4]
MASVKPWLGLRVELTVRIGLIAVGGEGRGRSRSLLKPSHRRTGLKVSVP